MTLTGSSCCRSVKSSPISMASRRRRESEITWRSGYATCAPIACGSAFAIEPWVDRSRGNLRSFARCRYPGGPDRAHPGIDREDGVGARELVQRGGHVLRVDRPPRADVVDVPPQLPARMLVALAHRVQEGAVRLCLDERENRFDRIAHVAAQARGRAWERRPRRSARTSICAIRGEVGHERVVGEVQCRAGGARRTHAWRRTRRPSRGGRSCRRRTGCRARRTACRGASSRPGAFSFSASARTSRCAPAEPIAAEERHLSAPC